ncbi:MAG TPA: DUF1573 domain-containing protein [Flavisolibacter sp.]|nr:DUF1573 domain-containing protein [Flavisolibacter sp.]
MKKFFLLAAAFVTSMAAMAQAKADEVIKVDTDKYDFGKLKQNVPATVYFTLTNTSDKPIVIENSWAGCGCTTPEVSKAPLAPNASTKIKVGYNAAAMGRFEKDVYVKLAGVQEPKVIKITGEVVSDVVFDAYTKTADYKKAEKARLATYPKDAAKSDKKSK